MSNTDIIVYGTTWCIDCHRSKRFLRRNNVPFQWIDIDENPDALSVVETHNNGKRIVPTLIFPDGDILVEPKNSELADKLHLTDK